MKLGIGFLEHFENRFAPDPVFRANQPEEFQIALSGETFIQRRPKAKGQKFFFDSFDVTCARISPACR